MILTKQNASNYTKIFITNHEKTNKYEPFAHFPNYDYSQSDLNTILYVVVLSLFILIGVIVNLIVILTYKYANKTNFKNRRCLLSMSQNGTKGPNSTFKTNDFIVNSCGHLPSDLKNFNRLSWNKQQSLNAERRLTIAIGAEQQNCNNKNVKNGSVLSTFINYGGRLSLGFNRIRRTLSSYFILSLGCCDLFICFFNISFILILQTGFLDQLFLFNYLNFSKSIFYVSSDYMCRFFFFFIQIPIALEIEILLTIALDRYFSVFRPIKLYYFDRKKLKSILVLLIFMSTLICLPNLFFYKSSFLSGDVSFGDKLDKYNNTKSTQDYSTKKIYTLNSYCIVEETHSKLFIYYQIVLFVLFFINLIVITICYLKVYTHVYKASLNQRRETISSFHNFTYNNHNNNSGSKLSSTATNTNRHSNSNKSTLDSRKIELNEMTINQHDNDEINVLRNNNKTAKFTLSEVEESDEFDNNNNNNNNNNNEHDIEKKEADDTESDNSSKTKSIKSLSKLKNDEDFEPKNNCNNNKLGKLVNNGKIKQNNHRASIFFAKSRRLRYLSESHIHQGLIKQHSFQSENGSNRSNSIYGEFNRMTIRRHTSRKFKHGKTARVLGIATFVLALTWSPYWFNMFMFLFDYKNKKSALMILNDNKSDRNNSNVWTIFLRNSFYLNYIINPIIYSFVDQRFRKNVVYLFKQAYLFLVKRGSDHIDIDSSPSHYPAMRSTFQKNNKKSHIYKSNFENNDKKENPNVLSQILSTSKATNTNKKMKIKSCSNNSNQFNYNSGLNIINDYQDTQH